MLEAGAVVGAVWAAARGWLTPAVLFVVMNLVIGTIAVASRLMPSGSAPAPGDEGERRSLLRAPSVALDRLRCFSFSRLGLAADHETQPPFDDGAPEPSSQPPATAAGPEIDHEREQARIERSASEAAAEAPNKRRPRARRTRRAATEGLAFAHIAPAEGHEAAKAVTGCVGAHRAEENAGDGETLAAAAVEVDERADDFIRRFREQLRLQRLDSILRYRDTPRRAGTA